MMTIINRRGLWSLVLGLLGNASLILASDSQAHAAKTSFDISKDEVTVIFIRGPELFQSSSISALAVQEFEDGDRLIVGGKVYLSASISSLSLYTQPAGKAYLADLRKDDSISREFKLLRQQGKWYEIVVDLKQLNFRKRQRNRPKIDRMWIHQDVVAKVVAESAIVEKKYGYLQIGNHYPSIALLKRPDGKRAYVMSRASQMNLVFDIIDVEGDYIAIAATEIKQLLTQNLVQLNKKSIKEDKLWLHKRYSRFPLNADSLQQKTLCDLSNFQHSWTIFTDKSVVKTVHSNQKGADTLSAWSCYVCLHTERPELNSGSTARMNCSLNSLLRALIYLEHPSSEETLRLLEDKKVESLISQSWVHPLGGIRDFLPRRVRHFFRAKVGVTPAALKQLAATFIDEYQMSYEVTHCTEYYQRKEKAFQRMLTAIEQGKAVLLLILVEDDAPHWISLVDTDLDSNRVLIDRGDTSGLVWIAKDKLLSDVQLDKRWCLKAIGALVGMLRPIQWLEIGER